MGFEWWCRERYTRTAVNNDHFYRVVTGTNRSESGKDCLHPMSIHNMGRRADVKCSSIATNGQAQLMVYNFGSEKTLLVPPGLTILYYIPSQAAVNSFCYLKNTLFNDRVLGLHSAWTHAVR